jgi:Lytic transglycolase
MARLIPLRRCLCHTSLVAPAAHRLPSAGAVLHRSGRPPSAHAGRLGLSVRPDVYGRSTASSEPFSRHELTAAHRTLPLGTKVPVHHLETDAQVVVKITDRRPYVDPRHSMDIH